MSYRFNCNYIATFSAVLALLVAQSSYAVVATWDDGGADPYWSTPENWVGDVVPPNDGTADILFDQKPNPYPETTVPWSINSLELLLDYYDGFTLSGEPITLGGGGITTSISESYQNAGTTIYNSFNLSSPQTWQIGKERFELSGNITADGHHLTIDNTYEVVLSGTNDFSGGLSKQGPGMLYFNSTPTVSGPIIINEGSVSIPTPTSSGVILNGGGIDLRSDADIALLIAPGSTTGTLTWNNQGSITFGGTNILDIGALGITGPLRLGSNGSSSIDSSAALIPDPVSKTLYFGAGSHELTLNNVLEDSPAGPTNVDYDGPGRTVLNGINTYTGLTTVSSGRVTANTPESFGSNLSPTILDGGEIILNAYSDEPFVVNGGSLVASKNAGSTIDIAGGRVELSGAVLDPVFTNTINASGGYLKYYIGRTTGTVVGPINLIGGGEFTIEDSSYQGKGTLIFNNTISGDGTIIFYSADNTIVNTTMTHTGDVVIGNYSQSVTFAQTQAFGGDLIIDGGVLNNNAPNTIPDLIILNGGVLEGSAPLTVLNPSINIAAGHRNTINIPGGLVGVDEFRMDAFYDIRLLDFGTLSNPSVDLQKGRLVIAAAAAEAINGPIRIPDGAFAEVGIIGNQPVMADIDLNNSTGISFSGALTDENTCYIGGTVSLGTVGAYIGGTDDHGTSSEADSIYISGRISGGDLTKVGTNWLRITGADNTYTGATIVQSGELIVQGEGHLSTTEAIYVHGDGRFVVGNDSDSGNQDWVADHIPVVLDNGIVQLRHYTYQKLPDIDETFGPLRAASGTGMVLLDGSGSGGSNGEMSLRFAKLERQNTAALIFDSPGGYLGTGDGKSVYFTEEPDLTNGIIGPWAIVSNPSYNRYDFATYDSVKGVGALSATGRPEDINAASITDHVRIVSSAEMSADRQVYSLNIDASVDLGGHTLSIESGGLILDGGSISNGKLTGGSGSHPELYVFAAPNRSLDVDIIDSQAGSTDLILSTMTLEDNLIRLYLGGNNDYTGTTYINGGIRAYLRTANAIPVGGDVVINGGLCNTYSASQTVEFGNLTLRNGGIMSSGLPGGFQAEQINVESGKIEGGLRGDAPLIKTTTGTLIMSSSRSDGADYDYRGAIDIYNGILIAEDSYVLGSGVVTLHEGGRLVIEQEVTYGNLVMNGGDLANGYGDSIFEGPIEVVDDSRVLTFHGLAGSTNRNSNSYAIAPSAMDVHLAGDVTIASAKTLSTLGEGELTISGSLILHDNAALDGVALVEPQSGKRVQGTGTIVGDVVVGDGAYLIPGFSAGTLTIDGDYTQLLNAIMQIEIGGTAVDEYDQLVVSGMFLAGGVFELSLINGYVPRYGDVFDILDFSGLVPGSKFDEYHLPGLDPGMTWDTSDLLITGEVRVVPEPTCSMIMVLALVLSCRRRRR